MRPRLVIAATLVALVICLANVSAAWAAGPGQGGGSGSGSLSPGGVGSGAGAPGGGGTQVSYTPPPPNAPPSEQSGYSYEYQGTDQAMVCLDNGSMVPYQLSPTGVLITPPGANPVGPVFAPTIYQLYGPSGQPVGNPTDVCPNVGNGAAAPPPPPPPPTPAEVWAATPLPAPHFNFNPRTLGLTQLPTWLWLTGVGGQVTATVTIRGYTVVTTAHPVAYYWYFGDGGSATGNSPGTQAQPSATHTYVAKGGYTVEVIIAWSGQYTFAGNGGPAETVVLGTVDGATAAAAYGVQEVRSVEVAGAGG